MTTLQLLTQLIRNDFSVWLDGDQLRVAPADRLTEALRAEIRALKPQLLEWLIEGPPLRTPQEIGVAVLLAYQTAGGYSFRHLRRPWQAANALTNHNLSAHQLSILAHRWANGNPSLDVPQLPPSGAQAIATTLQSYCLLLDAARANRLPHEPLVVEGLGDDVAIGGDFEIVDANETARALESLWTERARSCPHRELTEDEALALDAAAYLLEAMNSAWYEDKWLSPELSFKGALERAQGPAEAARQRREVREAQQRSLGAVEREEAATVPSAIEAKPMSNAIATASSDLHGYPENAPRKRTSRTAPKAAGKSSSNAVVEETIEAEELSLF